jgi:hypothetical protein
VVFILSLLQGISSEYTCGQMVDVICVLEEIRILHISYVVSTTWPFVARQQVELPSSFSQSNVSDWINKTFL